MKIEITGPLEVSLPTCVCFELAARTDAGACFDHSKRYRYLLWRRWEPGPLLGIVMLNPSIANAERLDPTVARVQKFAKRSGYGGFMVGNAFALVSTDPSELVKSSHSIVGPQNDDHLAHLISTTKETIVAWGADLDDRLLKFRAKQLRTILGNDVKAFDVTKSGAPRHPLYLSGKQEPSPYVWPR